MSMSQLLLIWITEILTLKHISFFFLLLLELTKALPFKTFRKQERFRVSVFKLLYRKLDKTMVRGIDFNRIQWCWGKHIRTAWFCGGLSETQFTEQSHISFDPFLSVSQHQPPSASSLSHQVHELQRHSFTEPRTANKKFSPPHPTTTRVSRISQMIWIS